MRSRVRAPWQAVLAYWSGRPAIRTFLLERHGVNHSSVGDIVETNGPLGLLWMSIGLGCFYVGLLWVNLLLGHFLTPMFLLTATRLFGGKKRDEAAPPS
jgi:hypothetical protein